MALPLVIAVIMGVLIYAGIYTLPPWFSEQCALILPAIFAGICIIRFLATRHLFFIWATTLLIVLFCREIHFRGTTTGVYVGFAIVIMFMLLKYDKLNEFLNNPIFLTFFAVGFASYFLTYTIDQRWWKALIPGEEIFHTHLEEFMEVFGHCVIGFTLVLSRKNTITQSE